MARLALAVIATCWVATATAHVDLDRYLKPDSYGAIRISPSGDYYAVTVVLSDRSVLWITRRSDGKVTAKATAGPHTEIDDFRWVNNQRVIIAWAKKDGALEKPYATGELFGLNADGSGANKLIGNNDPSAQGDAISYFSNSSFHSARLIDTLPRDADHVLVAISSYDANPMTRVVRMDVNSGRTALVATAPLGFASFAADVDGVIRFAEGIGKDKGNFSTLLYRAGDKQPWRTINEEKTSGHVEFPVGFSADDRTAYLQVEQVAGPDAIVAFDTAAGVRSEVLRDKLVDPQSILYSDGDSVPVGASFMSDQPHSAFFDEHSARALMQRSLEAAFPGQAVEITSSTANGQLLLLSVSSSRNPGDFYLYDRKNKSAVGVFSRRAWIDPQQMAATRNVELQSRDGVALHGYLTLPKGPATGLPMVVIPHGGPFGIFDSLDFDPESQLLADAGYAVLRINFRGSGNYGRTFRIAGARQWGARMQDDVTDATRWAIKQNIADPKRICIYGASYGGYAAMMGLAREPDLYKCGVGYAGVYDLPSMYRDDSGKGTAMETWLENWVGELDNLAAVSPMQLAAKITQPVFLAAGGEDKIVPFKHAERMEKALKAAGATPETLYFPTEGHGFYTEEHRHAFYAKLLDFLSRNLGGAKAQ